MKVRLVAAEYKGAQYAMPEAAGHLLYHQSACPDAVGRVQEALACLQGGAIWSEDGWEGQVGLGFCKATVLGPFGAAGR